jgi:hypothetical protein
MDKIITLVVVVSTSSCAIDEIDSAESHRIPIDGEAKCQVLAEALDHQRGVRAYCEAPNDQ